MEADETVILTVTAGTGYTVGTPAASSGTIQNDDASGNLALGRPAVASTTQSGYPAANATDGNPSSRWASQFSNNEWIYVDLGSAYTINRVVLRWEAAYGRGYKLQVSSNASSWSEVYSTTTGNGGVDDLTLAAPASGRYVRLLGTQRATLYGYSLWEFEVYGGTPTNHAPAVSSFSKSLMQDTPLPLAAADFTGAFTDPDAGDSLQKIKIASLPTHGVLSLNGTTVTLDQEITTAQIGTLTYTPNSGYTGSDSFQWNGSDGSLYAAAAAAVNLSINAAVPNLAWGKTAVASTTQSGYPAANVTDGNAVSRWSSQFSHNEWLYVDLGSVHTIDRVVLRWEAAYGRGYKLQVSNDASTWSDAYSTTTGDGGVDDITLSAPAAGRYVRMLGTQRATTYGYSLYELEVYGGGGSEAPEITVLSNGFSIADGDTTPSTGDGTDFGSVTQGDTAIIRTFTVSNDGTALLTLGTVNVPTGFTRVEGLSPSLAPGATDTFTVRLDTATAGTKGGDISFANNDGDENPFNFAITGVVTVETAPEITVLGNGITITNGDTTPAVSDGTNFGSVAPGGAGISRVFTVRNDGTVALNLGAVTVPTGYTLTEALSASLAPGTSDTFTVQLDTTTMGIKTGDISFTTNDADENPFRFRITGMVVVPGDLDLTFGAGGIVTTMIGRSNDWGTSMVVQPDGKIVVAGFRYIEATYDDFTVARYNTDGSLDSSFGTGGIAITALTLGYDQAHSVTLQPDGRIVVAGSANDDFAVVRYNTDGSLDTSFGTGGQVITALGPGEDYGASVALQPDGKILVAGYSYNIVSNDDLALVRYNANGSLDTSFGVGGKVIMPIYDTRDRAYSVAFQPDGKIVVSGYTVFHSQEDFALLRFNANGTLDPSFGVGGKVTTDLNGSSNDVATSMALQPDGRIVVIGVSYYDVALARYNTDGSLDASFGVDGKVITNVGGASDYANSLVIQPNGQILVAGGCNNDFALLRFNANGSLDTSFGVNGKVFTPIGSWLAEGTSVALQSDGRIVVAGYMLGPGNELGPNFDFALVRYLNDVSLNAEISVLGNAISISDEDTTPSASDWTDFGSATQGGAAVSRTFTVRNDGGSALTLGVVTVPAGFTLTEGLPGSLAPGASDTFTVQLETATVGTKSGEVSFATDDSDENPFTFQIAGVVTLPGEAEVTVTVSPSAVAEDGSTNLLYTFTRSVADSSALTVSFSVGGTATYYYGLHAQRSGELRGRLRDSNDRGEPDDRDRDGGPDGRHRGRAG